MKNIFTINKDSNPNYLATICKITELYPIENSDNLLRTVVNGYDIVVSKDTKVGDIVVYAPVESSICEGFLSANNLFELDCYDRNSNAKEIYDLRLKLAILKKEGKSEESKELDKQIRASVGFFNKHGRVRMIRLRGCPSMGFVTPVSSLVQYIPTLKDINWESLVGTSFSHINDIEFIKKYIPVVKSYGNLHPEGKFARKRNKKLNKFDKLIEGKFLFHYDTQMLNTNIWKLNPEDVVTITVKVHGTSAIFANVLCNKKLSVLDRVKKFFGFKVITTEYSNIYSSRSVIKNRYINNNVHDYYEKDVWGYVNNLISPYIEKGMIVYGEIAGFVPGTDNWIQKNHDYGCSLGHCKFMPYRITTENEDGIKHEWNVSEVLDWTLNLVKDHPELEDSIMPITILYHGKLKDLYPELSISDHWHKNLLAKMKVDKEHFLMEEDEPLCTYYNLEETKALLELESAKQMKMSKADIKLLTKKLEDIESKKAPREGIVIRIDDDPIAEAFKLKTLRHYGKEAEQHDAGEVDIEENEE